MRSGGSRSDPGGLAGVGGVPRRHGEEARRVRRTQLAADSRSAGQRQNVPGGKVPGRSELEGGFGGEARRAFANG